MVLISSKFISKYSIVEINKNKCFNFKNKISKEIDFVSKI